MRFARFAATATLGLFFVGITAADTLELKDGRVLEGRYLGGTQAVIRFETNGQVQTSYMRYYTSGEANGVDGALKYLVSGDSFESLIAAHDWNDSSVTSSDLDGLTDAQMNDSKLKETVDPFWGMTPRKTMPSSR